MSDQRARGELAGVIWVSWMGALAVFGTLAAAAETPDWLTSGQWQWTAGPPLVEPLQRSGELTYSVKDPSVVFFADRWHLFCTLRGRPRSHQIEYLTFADWNNVTAGRREWMGVSDGFYCAPQVFYFRPQQQWYLICQASDESWEPQYGAAFATTKDIGDVRSWCPLKPLGAKKAGKKSGLDFWIICDDEKAHLFFPTLDGHLWREETTLDQFPHGWSEPQLAIEGDIFEASHTYRLKGLDQYLTLIEAQGGRGWRYYKAYLADRLEGPWRPLAATRDKAFASMANVSFRGERWTDCISHGELLRSGCDEHLEVDPHRLQFVFQGVLDSQRKGKPYGEIPWKLGLLTSQ